MKNTGNIKKSGRTAAFHRQKRCLFIAAIIVLFLCSMAQAQDDQQPDNQTDQKASVALLPLIKGQNPEDRGETLTCPMGRFCYEEAGLKHDADRILTQMIQEKLLQRYESRAVPMEVVEKVYNGIRPGFDEKTPLEIVLEAGADLNVDYMLVGNVWRYQERIGGDYGVDQPASVAFTLYLVSVEDKEAVWSRTFAETQKSLSENLLKAGDFFRRGARWLTARELAKDGLDELMKTFPVQ